MLCAAACARIGAWFQAYENLEFLAVILLYLQIGCSLIGSLGISYIGLLLANLAIALFALVAIESGNQTLARIYALLLICALLLDTVWFILFAFEIKHEFAESGGGKFTSFSLEVVLTMQALGFSLRFFSAFLWLQMYRMGVQDQGVYQQLPAEGQLGRAVTVGLFSPLFTPQASRSLSLNDDVMGGSIYNPVQYSAHFTSLDENASIDKKSDGNILAELEQGLV